MGKEKGGSKKPPPSGGLMECPNYGTCQTMIKAAERGNSHRYGVYDAAKDDIVYKDCPGG